MDSSARVNSTGVDTPHGYRSFSIYRGDISTSDADLLVASSHAHPGRLPSGRVIRAFTRRHGIDFSQLSPIIVPRPPHLLGTYRVDGEYPAVPWKRMLLVRIPGADKVSDPLALFDEALWTLFGAMAALELRGDQCTSMALPFLGSRQDYPRSEAMELIVRHARAWLNVSRFMTTIDFYLADENRAESWSQTLNEVLGRTAVDSAHDHVVLTLKDEVLRQIAITRGGHGARFQEVLEALRNALQASNVILQQVAVAARVVAEHVVLELSKSYDTSRSRKLEKDIEALRACGRLAPWLTSYLHSLRILGNEEAHARDTITYQPSQLEKEDLIVILICLQRTLSLYNELRTPGAVPPA